MYVINDQNNTDILKEIKQHLEGNKSGTTIKFETKVIKSNLCGYSYAYILVTGDMTAADGNADTRVGFEHCAPLTKCITHINNEHVDGAENLDITMPTYNLIEYHDNYSDTSGSLWQFKGA